MPTRRQSHRYRLAIAINSKARTRTPRWDMEQAKFPTIIDTSISGRMNDALLAFHGGAYISAVTLALTIPDICGGRLWPDTGVGERYAKWFDTYVKPFSFRGPRPGTSSWHKAAAQKTTDDAVDDYFNGSDCYQLRCVYLHEGTNTPQKEEKTPYKAIQFTVHTADAVGGNGISELTTNENDQQCIHRINLDLYQFLKTMKAGTTKFLYEHPDLDAVKNTASSLYPPIIDFTKVETAG